ncbi:MAG: ABC transporter substrate-binding protein [Clostridia bacterium]|nr:ABC transporter substrate-binding protein [Clostridia bacterium]
MKKIFSAILCLFLCLLPLAACHKDDGLKKVKVNEVTHSIFYAPLYLADSLGYFEAEGIEIELTNGGGADKVMSAVLSGDAEVGFCGPEAALYVLAGGSTDVPTVFGQLTKRDGSFLVSRKAEPDFKWTDLAGAEILAGRKGGVPAMTFEYVLNNNGLYDKKDVTLNFDVAFNLMTSAFEAGTADYCTMFEPTASEYQAAGKGYIVASVGEASGEIPYTAFIAKQSWIDKNEDTAKGFLRAVTKAVKYLKENTAETAAPYLAKYFDSTSESSIVTSLKSYIAIDSWVSNMAMTEDSFNRLEDVIDNAGELPKRVDFSKLVNNSYAQSVYEEIYK